MAILAGAFAVLTGPGGQLEGSSAPASVESEYRFFAALWLGYRAVALWAAPRVERERALLQALMAVLFVAGTARGVAWIAAGRPHPLYVGLMCLELLIPPVAVGWQRRIDRGT